MFSLNWFKSEKQKQLEEENRQLKQQLEEKSEESQELFQKASDLIQEVEQYKNSSTVITEKPYKKVLLVGSTLTVIVDDETVLTKTNATKEDYQKISEATSREQVESLMIPQEVIEERKELAKEIEKVTKIREGFELLEQSGYFEIKDDSVYFKGINRSLPELLVNKFAELIKQHQSFFNDFTDSLNSNINFQSLVRFWKKCCLNPNAQSAEDLYGFLSKHQFKIDRWGNFYCYRRVKSKSKNQELINFISNCYVKVKGTWKKKCSDFVIMNTDEGYKLLSQSSYDKIEDYGQDILVGNLDELYKNLATLEENTYTSAHTGKENYKVGTIISMPRNEGSDDNTINCGLGFHGASRAYNYESFGDTDILMIVNPMSVLAVPQNEIGKLRTCTWFFACTLSYEERYILDDEQFDVTDLGDKFEELMLEEFEEKVKLGFTEETQRHSYQLPNISSQEIKTIVADLSSIKNELKNRVVKV